MKSTTLTYSVIVRNPNSWSASTGIHEELSNCGHKHKTVDAALACMGRMTAWQDGYTSARWYPARVEDSTGREYDNSGRPQQTAQELRAEAFDGI